jgi:Domain of unknown function (DUF1841)
MFNPSREQVRRFFSDTWSKYRLGAPLTGAEQPALDTILLHPEYHDLLTRSEESAQADYTPESGQMNPFLHLSLHLAIEEQLAIDQPAGIRAEFQRILSRTKDRHDALHTVLECLGESIWRAQRDGAPMDGAAYLECLRQH